MGTHRAESPRIAARFSRLTSKSRALTVACAAALTVALCTSLALALPASGTPRAASLADTARSTVRLSAPAFAQVPAADKSYGLKAARISAAVAAAAHAFHVNHVNHLRLLAARAASARAAATAAAYAKAHPARIVHVPPVPVTAPRVLANYSCSALEQLWTAEGGWAGAAFTAAEIARAESGGNPSAISPTSDYGLWQINSSNRPGSEMLNPFANAREAISLSGNGSNWSPWTTYTSGAYRGQCSGSAAVTTSRIVSTPTAPTAGSSGSLEYRAMLKALTRRGAPYVWAAAGPWAFDCSGLVVWSYAQLGVYEPHYTGDLWNRGYHVSSSQLRPGDLVFFYRYHSHVGIYIGHGQMVDAPHTGTVVQVQNVDWGSYSGAVRL